MINLIVLGGETKDLSELEEKAIALDGVVQGPHIDHRRKIYSFDHHGTVQRLCTTSASKQVMDALILGFNPDGSNVYINHADLDSVLAAYLLQEPELTEIPEVVELVRDVNDYDVHGPAYTIKNVALIDWLEAPYEDVQKRNKINDADEIRAAYEETLKRLKTYLQGKHTCPEEKQEATSEFVGYRIEYIGEDGWVLAESIGFTNQPEGYNPTLELYRKGYDKVILFTQMGERRKYSVCKLSDFIDFPVGPGDMTGTILFNLNNIEKGWGGGSTIGGSPRETGGSMLTPEQVCSIVDNTVRKSKKEAKELTAPEDIILMVNSAERELPVPERVMKNIGLSFVLEPIPDKRGCTTRYSDLKPTITLEYLSSAAVNSSLAYLHLARHCLEHQTIEGSYRFLLQAMTYSKWARGGGKTNQGMLEFTVPIVAAQMLHDPRARKDPFELLCLTTEMLKKTTREDVEHLIETKRMGNIFSNVENKYPVNEHPLARNVFEYYDAELEIERGRGYSTGIVHNLQFTDGFRHVGLLLEAFQESKEKKFSDRVEESYERLLDDSEAGAIGKGLAADLVATMLYMSFTYSDGQTIVR